MSATPQVVLGNPDAAEEVRDNHEKHVVERATAAVYRMLDDGLASIGGIVVAAGVCGGGDRSDLRKAIDRNGRKLSVDHTIALGARIARYNPTLATKIGSALVYPLNLEVRERVVLTDKERADRLEAMLRRMPHGDVLVDEALGAKR